MLDRFFVKFSYIWNNGETILPLNFGIILCTVLVCQSGIYVRSEWTYLICQIGIYCMSVRNGHINMSDRNYCIIFQSCLTTASSFWTSCLTLILWYLSN